MVRGGELDLIALDGATRVVVEVRTRVGRGDPIDAVDDTKREKVARLGAAGGARRVDLVGVSIRERWVDVHWVPDAL